MVRKEKLTIAEQVAYMRDDCGIQFILCTEKEAEEFLREHNYFFKIKAFAKNFRKDNSTGKYINLDFAHLKELSTLDALLRKEILAMAVDVEHFLKVGFITHLSENEKENGYDLVQRFFDTYPSIKQELIDKSKNSYCKDLVSKLETEGFAAWNVIELLSFGHFIMLYRLYSQNNGNWNNRICNLLISAKAIRNAAAHNNCLLNSIYKPYSAIGQAGTPKSFTVTKQLDSSLAKIPALKKSKSRTKKMENPVIHDFVALLYLFDEVVTSEKTKTTTYKKLKTLFHERIPKRKDYFYANEQLVSCYAFIVKVIDNLCDSAYNEPEAQKSS